MTSTDTSRDPLVGRTISGLTFIEKVAAEANWLIYRAKDTSAENRLVDVAILAGPPFEDERKRALFLKVGRTLASLDQENVVRVLKVIESPTAAYVVMEHFEGRTLASILKRERTLRADRAAHVISQVAKGLAAAHGWKLLHRSVCPAHVIVGENDVAKLGGFTLVPPDPGQPPGSDAIPYLAPERFSRGKPSTSADVFALGATFYHALTGKQPYAGETVAELAAAHGGDAPAAPRDVKANIPEEVDTLARAMIAPAKGYRLTMPQLIEKIDDLVASGAAKPGAKPGGKARPASALRPARKKKSMVGPIVAIVVLLIGGAIVAMKMGGSSDETTGGDKAAGAGPGVVENGSGEPKPPTEEELAIAHLAEIDDEAAKNPEPKHARKHAVEYEGLSKAAPNTSAGREAAMKARKYNKIANEYDKSGVKDPVVVDPKFKEHFRNSRALIATMQLDEAHAELTMASNIATTTDQSEKVRLEADALARIFEYRDKLTELIPSVKPPLADILEGAPADEKIVAGNAKGVSISGGSSDRTLTWEQLGPASIWTLTKAISPSSDEAAFFYAWLFLSSTNEKKAAAEAEYYWDSVRARPSPFEKLYEEFKGR